MIDHKNLDRALDLNEQMMELLNRQAKSFNIITISQIKGNLSPDLVKQALELVQDRHPRLRSRIVGTLADLRFDSQEPVTLPLRVVTSWHDQQWQDAVHEELNEAIDSSRSLLRAVLVRSPKQKDSCHLITTSHHGISDGLSCVQLHSQILTYCQKLASGNPLDVMGLSAPPSIESLFPAWTRDWRGAMRAWLFAWGLILKRLWHRPEYMPFEAVAPLCDRRCGIVHRQLDEQTTQQIISRCKQEGTTVQGALSAAMLMAAVENIAPDQPRPVTMNFQSAVNLRRWFKNSLPEEQLSLFAAFFASYYTVQPKTAFWDLARQIKRRIETKLTSTYLVLMALISKYFAEYFVAHPNEVATGAVLTNLGQVNIPTQYGPFELDNISFAASILYGGAFAIGASTFRDRMSLNFMFYEPARSRESMEQLADRTLEQLVSAAQMLTAPPQNKVLSRKN